MMGYLQSMKKEGRDRIILDGFSRDISLDENSVPYRGVLYFLVFLQCLWIGIGALIYESEIGGTGFDFKPWFYLPLFTVLFGGAILFSMTFHVLLQDFFRQFDYGEKFAFFLVHCVFFCFPLFIFQRFYIVFSFLSLNLFIVLCLVLPSHFTRLYASHLFLVCVMIIKLPRMSPLWPLAGFLLIALSMSLDYFYFKAQTYGEKRALPLEEFRKIALRYILPPLFIAGFIYWRLPPLSGRIRRFSFEIPLEQRASQPPDMFDLIVKTVIVALLLMIAIALLNWIQKKLRGGKPAPVIVMKGIVRRVQKFVEDKIVRPAREKLLDPKARIIHEYNRFCEEMGKAGFERALFLTPQEYAENLKPHTGDFIDHLESITATFEGVMYGASEAEEKDALEFKDHVKEFLGLFKHKVSPPSF